MDSTTLAHIVEQELLFIIFDYVFRSCEKLSDDTFWYSALYFDPRTPAFTFARNVYAMLRQTTKCICDNVSQLWINHRGLSTPPQLILARHPLESFAKSLHPILTAYFRQAASGEEFHMAKVKTFMKSVGNIRRYFKTSDEASDFVSRLSNDFLYRALTQLFYDCLTSGDNATLEFNNQIGQLMICAFSRDVVGRYPQQWGVSSGAVCNASVRLIFGVLKRLLGMDYNLPAFPWARSLPRLFDYLSHVEQWQDMQGFRVFCYVMRREIDPPSWELFSRCFYDAVYCMEDPTKITIVDPYEFGKVLTYMFSSITTDLVQKNTAVLLSIARLIAALRLQHPDLEAPATLDLSMVVGSHCCTKPTTEDDIGLPPRPLDLEGEEDLYQSKRGNLYPIKTLLANYFDLNIIADGFYYILGPGQCLKTDYMNEQVFNSFVLWLLSRFPANQLRRYPEAIHQRMRLLDCHGDSDDTNYVGVLKGKLPIN